MYLNGNGAKMRTSLASLVHSQIAKRFAICMMTAFCGVLLNIAIRIYQ